MLSWGRAPLGDRVLGDPVLLAEELLPDAFGETPSYPTPPEGPSMAPLQATSRLAISPSVRPRITNPPPLNIYYT